MGVGIPYIYELLFVDFVWPFTVLVIWLCILCGPVAYIAHKMNYKSKISFNVKLKTWSKRVITVYLTPIVIVSLLVPIFPQEIYYYEHAIYSKLNDMIHSINIDSLIIHHMHIFGLLCGFFLSLVLLAYGFQNKMIKRLSKKQLLLYFVVLTPILYLFLFLSTKVSLLTLIVIIGLPGALLACLK